MNSKNIQILKSGGVGIIPTDTVYGIACPALNKESLNRLFKIKGRDENKPPVVLISDISDLEKFKAKVSETQLRFIKKYWPGKVTIIFDISSEFEYLDKNKGLAIRLPADEKIRDFLRQTGPVATSSANLQGQATAKNIMEAKKYFMENVDFYEDWGELDSTASTLVKITGHKIEILRQGEVKILEN